MGDPPTLVIDQGTSRTVVVSDVVDGNGDPLDLTGWTVHAVARAPSVHGTVVGVWRTTPGVGEGTATISGNSISLDVPPDISDAWTFATAVLHIEVQEPGTDGRQERFGCRLVLDPTTVYS